MEELSRLKEKVQRFTDKYNSVEIENKKVVLYDGNPNASIMCIARDLGEEEVRLGRPLIGKAGQLFRSVAIQSNFDPTEDFFICNTVPLKPINNQSFSDKVRQDYKWVLYELFSIVRPSYIMTLGLEALKSISSFENIEKVGPYVGAVINVKGTMIFPNWHPSYVLRKGGLSVKEGKEFLNAFHNLYNTYLYDIPR